VAPTHLPQQPLDSALQLLGVLPVFADQSIPGGKQGSEQINAQACVLLAAEGDPLAPARGAFKPCPDNVHHVRRNDSPLCADERMLVAVVDLLKHGQERLVWDVDVEEDVDGPGLGCASCSVFERVALEHGEKSLYREGGVGPLQTSSKIANLVADGFPR
jgi:hypothetical protein